jgi:hypothetical protein
MKPGLEYKVERARAHVRNAESRVRQAKRDLDHGYLQEQAKLDQAKHTMEREYARLKEELTRAESELQAERAYLRKAETELANPFSYPT